MHIIEECAVWLQTNIDGDHAERFLALTQNWKTKLVPSVMPDVNPSDWLVEFWLSQFSLAGIQLTPQYRNLVFHLMQTKGLEFFMALIKQSIEDNNLPRVPTNV